MSLEVVVHLDRDLGLSVTKRVRAGLTAAGLKRLLTEDDPTGQVEEERFVLRLLLPDGSTRPLDDAAVISPDVREVVVSERDGSQEEGGSPVQEAIVIAGHCEYRVMQASLFKKRGADPMVQQVIRIKGRVGATVHCTGRVWRGPRGGEWVELDCMVERPGWLLVEGPGFGMRGPLLQKVLPGEEPPLVLTTAIPEAEAVMRDMDLELVMRDFVVSPGASVGEAKAWMATLFGCSPAELIIARPDRVMEDNFNISADALLSDEELLRDAGFKHGDEVLYVFTGKLNEETVKELERVLSQDKPDASPETPKGEEGVPKDPPGAARGGAGRRPPRDPGKPPDDGRLQPRDRKARMGQRTVNDIIRDCPDLRAHFKTLHMENSALQEGIKRHYRQLALECHPDKCPEEDARAATQRFQEVKAAYEAIRDRLLL